MLHVACTDSVLWACSNAACWMPRRDGLRRPRPIEIELTITINITPNNKEDAFSKAFLQEMLESSHWKECYLASPSACATPKQSSQSCQQIFEELCPRKSNQLMKLRYPLRGWRWDFVATRFGSMRAGGVHTVTSIGIRRMIACKRP